MKGYKGYRYKMQRFVDVIPAYEENCAPHILACGHSFLMSMNYSRCYEYGTDYRDLDGFAAMLRGR